MSYLSASENVGFSGITQNISEASCATQYKMAVESVSGGCGEGNIFTHDSSGDEESYIPHLSESFFHTKFKIDPSDLYTFHDSDVIAGEITVSHTEDNFIISENIDLKGTILKKGDDSLSSFINGAIKKDIKEIVTNGYTSSLSNVVPKTYTEPKLNAKVQQGTTQINSQLKTAEITDASIPNIKVQNSSVLSNECLKPNVSNLETNNEKSTSSTKSNSETFLDVFKREQGVNEKSATVVKTEPSVSSTTPLAVIPPKPPTVKSSQSKPRKGRGPTVHEALQRIPHSRKVLPLPNKRWHAPGEEMFNCGPLDDKKPNAFRQLESSSSDDDNMPEFESGSGPVCVEETAVESRGARLALRRAAMRRQVARAATSLQLNKGHKRHKLLASLIKKQISGKSSSCQLPPQTVNHLLAMRGMTSILTVDERRQLRESGWSGGESCQPEVVICEEERCTQSPLPCGQYCLSHVTLAPEQRLYAACAAVFAGGERCKQPLLPLQEQTPLCAEHAWKRDNYEMLSRENKPPKVVRKRPWVPNRSTRPSRSPRRPKRRRRLDPKTSPAHEQSLSEINVCSNSSTYDSSEDTAMGGLSENEYMTNNSHELEVGQVPPDDILDPSVLSQMPDEAFTEFFNQAESGAPFGESSELAAALEAVLDERALDITDVFSQSVQQKNKMVPAPAVTKESTSAPS